jgi:hypothetical protein
MRRLGLGDLGAGRSKGGSEKIEGLADFPIRMPKTAPNLPPPEYAQFLRSQSELFANLN